MGTSEHERVMVYLSLTSSEPYMFCWEEFERSVISITGAGV